MVFAKYCDYQMAGRVTRDQTVLIFAFGFVGAFKFTPNAIYVFVPLLFWGVGIYNASIAGLIGAANLNIGVWIHYFCIEKPDMEILYGETKQTQ